MSVILTIKSELSVHINNNSMRYKAHFIIGNCFRNKFGCGNTSDGVGSGRDGSVGNDSLRAGNTGDRIPVAVSFFAPVQTHPSVQWVPSISRGVNRPDLGADHPPHLTPWLKKE